MLFKNDLTKPYVCIRLFLMVFGSMMMKDLWFLFSLIFSATWQRILYIFYLSMTIVLTWTVLFWHKLWVVWICLVHVDGFLFGWRTCLLLKLLTLSFGFLASRRKGLSFWNIVQCKERYKFKSVPVFGKISSRMAM